MATTTAIRRGPGAWVTIAFAMFAVGWGANQFSPMLIVYRHELRLTAGEVAGLFLVSGLRQAEHMARPDERGAVIACYYALAYLGFAVPYLADGLGVLVGKTGAFVVLTAIIAGLALWTGGYAAHLRRAVPGPEGDTSVRPPAGESNSVSR
jgi:hypothetical protein